MLLPTECAHCCTITPHWQAAAQEAAWAKQIATSDSRADNAQGMATAMEVKVAQREAALAKRQAKLDAQQGARLHTSDELGSSA
jgi:hypothetical protein